MPDDLLQRHRAVLPSWQALYYEHLIELGYEVEDLGDLDVIIPETQHYGDPQAKYLKEIADACAHLARMTLDAIIASSTSINCLQILLAGSNTEVP